ncbi:class I SAM-dependent methyltransferase [Nocardia terpenica]|uniref:SAM-dependent methyltransferase n=1 Tax=Nocardia terpenica TaxID=455432 RepID=A0A164IR96_9NOCA|nr:class I SAM-dependent methyltransferase [Nocardia terpenica]KZM69682.1 SAM-dependent methyltransferase [Nocardia terpenica]NQE89294.1 class I SAM-dependent methyltransferase [Nocardia terpenica]
MDAAEWDARYAHSELVWGAPPNATVVEHVYGLERRIVLQPDVPGGDVPPLPRALDLACGEGRNALWLATHGWQVRAVDFAQVGIDKGRTIASRLSRSVRSRIDWHCADLTDPDTAGITGPFELVLMVFLHLLAPQRGALLARVAEQLSPGGVLLVLGHDTTNITDGYGGPQDPTVLFTPDDIVRDLAAAGDHVRIRLADRVFRETEGRDAIDALVVATRTVPDLDEQATTD